MVFAREINDPLTGLVKKMDAVTQEKGSNKLGSVVVFLGDDEKLEKAIKDLAEKEKVKKTTLMLDNKAGPEDFHIDKNADVTVLLYVDKTVKVNRAYKKGEFKAEDVDKVIKDLPKILDAAE
jgi:hypothetical protein